MPVIDYSKRYRDYARFTPAISEMYTRYVVAENPKRYPPVKQEELDFLNPETGLFYLPCGLYSAGQAAKSSSNHKQDMVTGRDKSHTTILGDSGGFQIQTGAIKFEGDKTRRRMMEWLETNCDWSMILDFPTGGIAVGNIDQHLARLEHPLDPNLVDSGNKQALDDLITKNGGNIKDHNDRLFYACMLQTLINNDWFVQNRTPGKTKFLNVVQGRNPSESKTWYENVKHYPFEGWSLASHHKENFEMALGRIINMRDDNLLANRDWLHFLGVGKFQHGCVYTTIQRQVREQINPNFTISYDVSSPFTLAAYGKVFLGYNLNKDSWSIQGEKLDGRHFLPSNTYLDDEGIEQIGHEMISTGKGRIKYLLDERGEKIPLPPRGKDTDRPFLEVLEEMFHERLDGVKGSRFIKTEVGKRLKMGDLCVNVDPKFTSTWDVVTYALLMNHNVQVHLEGVFESQELYDEGDVEKVPIKLLELKGAIEEVFKSETPYDVIHKNRKVLNYLASGHAENGVPVLNDFEMPSIKEHLTVKKKRKDYHAAYMAENKDAPTPVFDLFHIPEEK